MWTLKQKQAPKLILEKSMMLYLMLNQTLSLKSHLGTTQKAFESSKTFLSHFLRVPGVKLEPKEKGGEVTLISFLAPCIRVMLKEGEGCEIHNIRMFYRGPTKEEAFL